MDIITYALLKKKIDNLSSFSFKGFKKVSVLPLTGDARYIYLLPRGKDNYDEYIWVDNRWELIGNVNTDLKASYYKPSVDAEGNLTWTPSQESLPPVESVNIKGPRGESIVGAAGLDGRSVEFRKGKDAIEWKLVSEVELNAIYNSAGIKSKVYSDDIITKINLLGRPSKAVYAKIKTVTGYGVDDNGKDIANVNCSATSPADFPFLGGFNPKKAEIILDNQNTFNGNMSILTAQEELLKYFSGTAVTKVDKIRIWVYFLDVDKNPLGSGISGDGAILVDLFIKDPTNNWKELIKISELQGSPDEQSLTTNPQGKLAIAGFEQAMANQIPIKQEDGQIKWTTINPEILSGDISSLIQTEIIRLYGGSATEVMEV